MFAEDDLLPISALQHLIYCPRQCALIHLERQWADNRLTVEGQILHRKAHDPARRQTRPGRSKPDHRPLSGFSDAGSPPAPARGPSSAERLPSPDTNTPVRIVRAMPVRSLHLGLLGVCDVVEFPSGSASASAPLPIEYKRGRPKAHDADEVQLAAQALCIEEMLGIPGRIGLARLYYGKIRRRVDVAIDGPIRDRVRRAAADLHALIASGRTPAAVYDAKRCDRCSLLELCQPRSLRATLTARDRFHSALAASLASSGPDEPGPVAGKTTSDGSTPP